jgi:hypothetical protein
MDRYPQILNAASNLLGICFIIISGFKIANLNSRSYADEFAWAAAFLLLASVIASYMAIRNSEAKDWLRSLADRTFFGGVVVLTLSVLLAATTI